jgi:hypothetical protein
MVDLGSLDREKIRAYEMLMPKLDLLKRLAPGEQRARTSKEIDRYVRAHGLNTLSRSAKAQIESD